MRVGDKHPPIYVSFWNSTLIYSCTHFHWCRACKNTTGMVSSLICTHPPVGTYDKRAWSLCGVSVQALEKESLLLLQTRMMSGAYPSQLNCLKQILTHEGPLKLLSGFIPGWARLGPWQFIFWVTYERLRKELGLPGF